MISVPYQLRYKYYRAIINVGNIELSMTQAFAMLNADLNGIMTNQSDIVTLLALYPFSNEAPLWSFDDNHPVYGVLRAEFTGSASISADIPVEWDPPENEEAYIQIADSHSIDPFFALEENTDWVDVWPYTWQWLERNPPPYIWAVDFYKIQYYYHNWFLPSTIIPQLSSLGVLSWMFALSNLGTPPRFPHHQK